MRVLVPSMLLSALAAAPVCAQDGPPAVGEPFPALAFPTLDSFGVPGEPQLQSITEFEGTKVLLVQFSSW